MIARDKAGGTVTRLPQTTRIAVSEDAMNLLRRRMHDWHHTELAEKVGVSSSCIMAIRSGRTKWPRPHTMFRLLEVLNLEMLIRDKSNR